MTWGTPVQSFVFLGLLVSELEPMYATSDRRTDRQTDGRTTVADHRIMPPRRGHNNIIIIAVLSVSLFVRLSVCPSRSGILSKRINIVIVSYHTVAQSFYTVGQEKLHPFYFRNNLVKPHIISTIFGTQIRSKFATKLQQDCPPLLTAVFTIACETKHKSICS